MCCELNIFISIAYFGLPELIAINPDSLNTHLISIMIILMVTEMEYTELKYRICGHTILDE